MHTHPIMRCHFAKVGSDRVGAKFPTRLRPLIVDRMTAMRAWRMPLYPTKDVPSKKALLLNNEDKPSPSKIVVGNIYGLKIATKPNLRIKVHKKSPTVEPKSNKKTDAYEDGDDEIGTIGAFPASPSFRIFFLDALDHNLTVASLADVGRNDIVKEIRSEEICVEKKVRRDGRRRNFRRAVSGKGREAGLAMKKGFETLSNVKACYCNNTLPAAERRKERL